jgi:hypothetical protein
MQRAKASCRSFSRGCHGNHGDFRGSGGGSRACSWRSTRCRVPRRWAIAQIFSTLRATRSRWAFSRSACLISRGVGPLGLTYREELSCFALHQRPAPARFPPHVDFDRSLLSAGSLLPSSVRSGSGCGAFEWRKRSGMWASNWRACGSFGLTVTICSQTAAASANRPARISRMTCAGPVGMAEGCQKLSSNSNWLRIWISEKEGCEMPRWPLRAYVRIIPLLTSAI